MSDIKEEDDGPVIVKTSGSAENPFRVVANAKKNRLASRFIPTCNQRCFEYENQQSVGHPESVKENPDVSITICGLLTRKKNKEIEVSKTVRYEEPGFWLSTGPLGMCNNTYCMTCPTYSQDKKKQMKEKYKRERKQTVHQKFQDEESAKWTEKCLFFMHKSVPGVVNPHSAFVQWWDRVFLISCLVATFVDPLFFFLLSVQQVTEFLYGSCYQYKLLALGNKCITFDWTLAWIIVILRSFTDLLYLLHMLLQFRMAYIKPEHRVVGLGVLVTHPKEIVCNYLKGCFWIDIFVVLPLPQVMTMLVRIRITLRQTSANYMKNVLCLVVLFQYLPRLCRFLPMLAGRSATKALIFETAWAQFFINILSFMLAGHIVGSCWYLFGLERVNQCLKEACNASHLSHLRPCNTLIDCEYGFFYYIYADSPLITLDEWRYNPRAISCFTEQGFSYGIYIRAVNLTTEHNVVVRYIYSLFWGFQQISTLAGNQSPSYFVWEVLFTMAIVGFGLLLFALLIGNIQNFLQALGKRRMDMLLRRRDVDQWMSHRRFPEEMKMKVRHAEEYSWKATQGVDEEKLLVSLPEDLQTDIRRHLFKFLKEVKIFSAMDEAVLDSIAERLRHRTYITGCQILFPLGPIKKMTFIVRGEMESDVGDGYVSQLSAGDVCGEELLIWHLEDSTGDKEARRGGINGERPTSNRTVKCVTNVEAFVLGATDLEEVTSLFAKFLQNQHVQMAIRYELLLPYTRRFAARRIQAAWRNRMKRLNHSNTAQVSKSLIPPRQRKAGRNFRLFKLFSRSGK